eukprot:364613-Chlamydomonas_euryale.AAC.6
MLSLHACSAWSTPKQGRGGVTLPRESCCCPAGFSCRTNFKSPLLLLPCTHTSHTNATQVAGRQRTASPTLSRSATLAATCTSSTSRGSCRWRRGESVNGRGANAGLASPAGGHEGAPESA